MNQHAALLQSQSSFEKPNQPLLSWTIKKGNGDARELTHQARVLAIQAWDLEFESPAFM